MQEILAMPCQLASRSAWIRGRNIHTTRLLICGELMSKHPSSRSQTPEALVHNVKIIFRSHPRQKKISADVLLDQRTETVRIFPSLSHNNITEASKRFTVCPGRECSRYKAKTRHKTQHPKTLPVHTVSPEHNN